MKKVLSAILCIAVLVSAIPFVFADDGGNVHKGKIKVGVSADYKPFEYYDENGNLAGFDIDLMKYIGEKIGCEIEFSVMPFDMLISSVINSDVDCAISSFTFTEERDAVIDFSRPYLKTQYTFLDNGQKASKYGEEYAIVFREGLSDSPYNELTNPTRDEAVYVLVDKAIRDLSNDKTITKLIEKHKLNKPFDENEVNTEYSAIMGDGTPAQKLDSEPGISGTSVQPSDWASADIQKASDLNLISGNYNFPSSITREEFCNLAYNYVSEYGRNLSLSNNHKFDDTDNEKTEALASLGIIQGKSETEFAPSDFLTREEAATILSRLINVVHPDWASTELYFEFSDNADISDWAMNSVQRMCNMGIMKGVGDNRFAPQESYTTEQAIVTLVRVCANSGASKNINDAVAESSAEPSFSDKLNLLMPSDKNYMFSPLSIKMAFAMAANGADGNTKAEILNALDIENLDEYNKYAQKLIEAYRKADILKLDIANALWINESNTTQKFSPKYQNTLENYYNAEANSSTKDKIAGEINSWVKEKTNDKIDSIITDALAQDERFIMALLNAVYFKAAWQNEFNEAATTKDIFTDRNGIEKQTDFMNRTAHYNYYNENGVEVLALPYKNRIYDEVSEKMQSYDFDVSMYLIRGAYNESSLSALIENGSLSNKRIQLSMPKFESEFDTSLVDIMKKIGVSDAFVPSSADFGKMFDKGNAYLMDAVHKTYIKVDEKGTEAAAVTGLMAGATSMPAPPVVVKFNTPFTYIIRDNANGEILFMGEYAFAN